ncbi:Mur ligase family protein [Wenzhouxiangella sp. EGI_FJ10409]|uniref:Mur ligase family protein n=1 Tax=Wenzhouxiangella sp. EGI_FJ10409 TaxID=3243767 RepID=UPI0035DE3ACC
MRETSCLTYAGPNRRSDLTVIEKAFALEPAEWQGLAGFRSAARLSRRLQSIHPALAEEVAAYENSVDGSGTEVGLLGHVYAGLCISLQRAARHPVAEVGVLAAAANDSFRVFFEYEAPDVGRDAADIAQAIVESFLDEDHPEAPAGGRFSALTERIDRFLAQAVATAMPADTRAIHDAARSCGIPCLRMDRPPFHPVEGDFRIRPNGLLRLGYGHRQHTVDGTFCVSRSQHVFALVRDREALFGWLAARGFSLPGGENGSWFGATLKAARAADRLGYPVCLRTSQRGRVAAGARPLADREAVVREAGWALQYSPRVLVQPWLAGTTLRVLVAGQTAIAVFERIEADGDHWRRVDGHADAQRLALELARSLGVGLAMVTLVQPEPGPSIDGAGSVIDVELAPELDRVFSAGDSDLQRAARAFVDWIFPDSARARIPVIAVTGTNGKTTTTRMLERIMSAAGHATGLACSDGSYVGGTMISEFEDGFLPGHLTVLDNPATEVAVLETTRGGAGSAGLGFDRCDVAVCLNVTADHLNDFLGLRSVADLARLKRSILERARRVVLNADDEQCRAMIEPLGARVSGMVSMSRSAAELHELFGRAVAVGAVELLDGREWLVISDSGRRVAVIAVDDIPMAFDGAARHNVSNALSAAMVAWLMDQSAETIAAGLRGLQAGFETTPGRLNFFRELPFDVCVDFAHNPDGVSALGQFVDRLSVTGRCIVCLSCNNKNEDDFIRETAGAAAGHFDHYVCKNFGKIFDRAPGDGPRLLREGLLAAGVSPGAVTCVEGSEEEGVEAALGMGRPGDLVVIVGGKRRQALWRLINDWPGG